MRMNTSIPDSLGLIGRVRGEVIVIMDIFKCSFSTKVSSFQGVGVPLYTEVSSFQGVGIEEFHCIQRCPHFMELE